MSGVSSDDSKFSPNHCHRVGPGGSGEEEGTEVTNRTAVPVS